MTTKPEPIEVQFFCMPDVHDLDVALHSDTSESDDSYCWTVHQGFISAELFKVASVGPCPKCGSTVDVKPVTAVGTFLDATNPNITES